MAQTIVMRGADIKVYLGGTLYRTAQSISWTIDYGEQEIYGIDSQFPQEISPTRMSVQGNISGLRVKLDGGLQGRQGRSKITDILSAPYTSLRVRDRHSDVDILFIPQMKVTNEQMQIQSRGVVKLSFQFKGIIPYNEVDIY